MSRSLLFDLFAGPEAEGEIRALDEELFRVARGSGRLRLRLGQALDRLGEDYRELGFSTLGAYALERCSRTGRWAADTRALARRLEELPQIRGALEEGVIAWSMAELLARHATGETEAALLGAAQGQTVRAMRDVLKPVDDSTPEEEEERWRTLSLTLPMHEAWSLEATRMVIEHMNGTGEDWFESLLAEGQTSLLAHLEPEEEVFPADVVKQYEAWLKRVARLGAARAKEEARAAKDIPVSEVERGQAPPQDDLPLKGEVHALDRRLGEFCAELSRRDLYLGRLVGRFFRMRGHEVLGYASETQYARERLGMSRASVRSKMGFVYRARELDETMRALEQGVIGFEAAQLVARVATVDTEAQWLQRAQRRTFKHLREEVRAVELGALLFGDQEILPPDDEELGEVQAIERLVLSGEMLREALACGGELPTPESCVGNREPVQMSGSAVGKVEMKIRVREDIALHFRQLEEAYRRQRGDDTGPRCRASFIRWLCLSFWQAWSDTLGHSDKWEAIYRRDRYRCTSPVCHRRNVTLHHMTYRAHGGGDEHENLTSPCDFCHLEGEHGGRLKIVPPASDPTWILGRQAIMVVEGRERTLLRAT